MNHFLTSVDWSRTCPLQLRKAATSAVSLSFTAFYVVAHNAKGSNTHLAMKFLELSSFIVLQPMY